MAIIGNKFVDLIDMYKQQNPDGTTADVIEMLNLMNPILEDAIAVECNKSTTHMHTVRTGLPNVAWGRLYQGIPQSKNTYAQVEDTTGFVEGMSTVDERLLALGNAGAIRLNEAMGFLEAMSQEVASRLFYGNSATDPEQFMGLTPRYNDLSAPNGNNIINGGGSSDLTSIWFVTWSDRTTHLLYPKGTQAGVKRQDMGRQRVTDAGGNAFYAMEEMFSWHVGLAVKDWRYNARIANIDVTDLQDGSLDIYDLMRKAYYRLQNRRQQMGSFAIYCNRDVLEALDAQATNKGTDDNFVRLRTVEVEGREIKTYRGIPIRECDSIINDEEQVV